MRFQCYEAIGVAIGEAGNVAAADHLIEDVLSWRFQYPEIQGATDEWETVVNPYHLPKIRCWMHIIESNPALYERLAAALNVQLRLGGVYIADTDLFQRDVTRFLNADIGPIYFVAKQLLRAFPVYFNDVGAEGELRAVSTEIDEICGRRDTLMHFLRKQSHAESSNRLVDFSRAVLGYWITLDPAALQPYLSANTWTPSAGNGTGPRGPTRSWSSWGRYWAAGRTRAAPLTPPRRQRGMGARRKPATAASRLRAALDVRRSPAAAPGPGKQAPVAGPGKGPSRPPAQADARGARAPARHPPRRSGDGETARRRVALMIRTYQLLAQKYSLSADDIGNAVSHHLQLDARTRAALRQGPGGLAQTEPGSANRDRLLDVALTVLEQLQRIVLSPAPSVAVENIYQKRHIAAGIPSMYGNYTEPKFDALGLSFRVENLVAVLLEDLVSRGRGALRHPGLLAAHGRGHPPLRARSGHRRGRLPQPGAPTCACSSPASAATTSPSTSIRTSSSSSWARSPSCPAPPSSATTRCCTPCSSTIPGSARPGACRWTRWPRWCCARCWSRRWGCRPWTATCPTLLRQISTLTGRLSNHALTRMMNYDPERLVSRLSTRPSPAPTTR